jgi:hypothetical protein
MLINRDDPIQLQEPPTMETQTTDPAPAAPTLDIYDPRLDKFLEPTNPHFVNPNDVLQMYPDDMAARHAATNVDVIQATVKRTVKGEVSAVNAGLIANYNVRWATFLALLASRQVDKSTAPVPPNAYVIGYVPTSPNPDAPLWPYPMIGTTPVCQQPPVPDLPAGSAAADPNAPPPGELGMKVNGAFDTFPVGYQATRADGSVWQKFSSPTLFGGKTQYWECTKGAPPPPIAAGSGLPPILGA